MFSFEDFLFRCNLMTMKQAYFEKSNFIHAKRSMISHECASSVEQEPLTLSEHLFNHLLSV